MDPIHPWIDASEMRELAEKLIHPSSQPVSADTDAGFSENFVGFAQLPNPGPSPKAKPATAEEAPPLAELTPPNKVVAPTTSAAETPAITPISTATPAAATTPTIEPSRQPEANSNRQSSDPSIAKSAEDLQVKLAQNYQADGIFILNRAGEKLFGRETHKRFQFIARNLIQLASRKGAPSGNVRIKVGPARILEIISADTAGNGLILGTIAPEPFTPEIRKKISKQLESMHISRARS